MCRSKSPPFRAKARERTGHPRIRNYGRLASHRGFAVGLEVLEALIDFVPVNDVPPGLQVFGTAVVVLQVVGVFPDVVAHDGVETLGDGIVLVGSAEDLHLAAGGLACEPDPSAAELLGAGFVELSLEIFEAAEGVLDDVGDGAGGLASALGLHDLPEHGVIHVASAVVADGGADVFGDGVEVTEQLFDALGLQFGMLFEGGVGILHIRAVVQIVVELHGFGVNVRLQSGIVIRQRGQFESHDFPPVMSDDGAGFRDSVPERHYIGI